MAMFMVYCAAHDGHALLSASSIRRIERGVEGLRVAFDCTCGRRGEWVVRKAPEETSVAPARAPGRELEGPGEPVRGRAIGLAAAAQPMARFR